MRNWNQTSTSSPSSKGDVKDSLRAKTASMQGEAHWCQEDITTQVYIFNSSHKLRTGNMEASCQINLIHLSSPSSSQICVVISRMILDAAKSQISLLLQQHYIHYSVFKDTTHNNQTVVQNKKKK